MNSWYVKIEKGNYRKTLPVPDELELDEVNKDVLLEMTEKFPKSVTKRLFALLGDHFINAKSWTRAYAGFCLWFDPVFREISLQILRIKNE